MRLAAGIYAYSSALYVQIGQLAATDPKGKSPIFGPPYTNLDASLILGAATYQLGPTYASRGDIWGIPDGLVYMPIPQWHNFLVSAPPFEAVGLIRDSFTISCNAAPTAFGDHLSDIKVPVFYVAAGGGFGRGGLHTLTLLGSRDVSSHIVRFYPPEQAAFDFGPVDLFYAQDAENLVWSPIYQWHGEDDDGGDDGE